MTDTLLETGPRHEAQDDHKHYIHPISGQPYLSVTYVIGASTSKPWLGDWAAKSAAQYAVDFAPHWQATFRDQGRDAAINEIKRISSATRDLKAEVGTYEHDIIEALFLDQPIPGIPDHLDGKVIEVDDELAVIDQAWLDSIADGFLNFVADFEFSPIAAECTVASDEEEGAGTIDAIGRSALFPELKIGIDAKTGAKLGREVYAQLGAYSKFPQIWLRNGTIVRTPKVDRWAVLHLRPSYSRGYKLLLVSQAELELGWAWWQQCRAQVAAAETVPTKFGRVLYPPLPDGTQPPPMVEDLTSFAGCSRAVKPLRAAGFVWLSDVALLERADILAIKGVGAKTADALERVLAEHDLRLAAAKAVA